MATTRCSACPVLQHHGVHLNAALSFPEFKGPDRLLRLPEQVKGQKMDADHGLNLVIALPCVQLLPQGARRHCIAVLHLHSPRQHATMRNMPVQLTRIEVLTSARMAAGMTSRARRRVQPVIG